MLLGITIPSVGSAGPGSHCSSLSSLVQVRHTAGNRRASFFTSSSRRYRPASCMHSKGCATTVLEDGWGYNDASRYWALTSITSSQHNVGGTKQSMYWCRIRAHNALKTHMVNRSSQGQYVHWLLPASQCRPQTRFALPASPGYMAKERILRSVFNGVEI